MYVQNKKVARTEKITDSYFVTCLSFLTIYTPDERSRPTEETDEVDLTDEYSFSNEETQGRRDI